MANPAIHWEICSKDIQKSLEFYKKVFDWTFAFNKSQSYWKCEDCEGEVTGGLFEAQDEMPSYVAVFFEVDDPGRYMEKAISMGAMKIIDPMEVPGECIYAFFIDPDGNPIGLMKRL